MHPEFGEDVMQVLLDRPFRNAEGVRDLPVGHSLHQQVDDLTLAASERWRRRARCSRRRLTPVTLSSLAFAAVTYAPVADAPLGERPLQPGRTILVRN